MLILKREPGQTLMIEDVQLTLVHVSLNAIVFSMAKLAGGRETKVRIQRNQIVDVCYNVKFQVLSIEGQSARLMLEFPESVKVQPGLDDEPFLN